MSASPPQQFVLTVRILDRLAHTMFTWVRHETMCQRFNGEPLSAAEQSTLATGFIAGLRTRIGLCDSDTALIAYTYALMNGRGNDILLLVDTLLKDRSGQEFSCSGYLHGLHAARTLLSELPFSPMVRASATISDSDYKGSSDASTVDELPARGPAVVIN